MADDADDDDSRMLRHDHCITIVNPPLVDLPATFTTGPLFLSVYSVGLHAPQYNRMDTGISLRELCTNGFIFRIIFINTFPCESIDYGTEFTNGT